MKRKVISIIIAAASLSATAQPKLTVQNIKEVVAAMTLEEKAALVVGTQRGGVYPPPPAPGMPVRPTDDPENKAVTAFSEGRVRGAAGDVYAVPRLGIPTMVLADGPAGLRIDPTRPNDPQTYYCTAFPTASLLAATWDAPLVERMTQAMGSEVKEYGVDVLLAPGMNIMRAPRCGRNYEYFSEDPVLAGKLAAAYIRGVQSQGVGMSLKHFAVNNQETYRNGVDVRVSEQALREIYLRGFEIAVKEGKPWTIMSSYNKINGILASENRWLLKDVLRREWGFDGFVMTDWWAEENGARQIGAGNDMLMPGTQRQLREILDGIRAGVISESDLDWCVENILRVLVKTPVFKGYQYSNQPDLKANAQVAREIAAEGMVLLENNGVLPLKKGKRVALLGVSSYDALVGGSGSGHVNRAYEVSIYEGLRSAGFRLDEESSKHYIEYVEAEKAKQNREFFWVVPTIDELAVSEEQAEQLAQRNDVCILTIGRMAGEGDDRRLEKGDYYLSDLEMQNLQHLCTAFHAKKKSVVVLLSMGSFVDMASWKGLPDAILHTWLPGQEEGNAIADVLTGKVNPSGKLPFTIAARYEDYPSATNFPQSNGNPAEVEYKEGVYVGYRHFGHANITPTYPFGYGLSYTTFRYDNLKVKTDGENVVVSVSVKNTGHRAGKESVQLYVAQSDYKELKAFAKTRLLKHGESQLLTMTVSRQDLASWDSVAHRWTINAGTYTFCIGASATDVRQQINVNITPMEQKEIALASLNGSVKRIFEDKDNVFAHLQDKDEAVITVLRYDNGIVVERMENRQQIPATTNPSGHTMLDGETEIIDKDKTEQNKALVSSLLDAMLKGRSSELPSFFDGDNYINHNPKAYDGLSGFAKGMAERVKSGIVTKYERVRLVLGEGNYVLAITEGTINDVATAFFDIFRVENGKVAEHWDVVNQTTPNTFQ